MNDLDTLDQLAANIFEGYLVRKDLAQQFRGQYPVPTYVGEFLLGRYCATTDPDEIAAGLALVERSLKDRTVRAGEEELFKARARDKGRIKIIDLLKARLDTRQDAFKAELPSLQERSIHIDADLVNQHERMLTGGFYAEVTLQYIPQLAAQQGGQPFRVDEIRPIQMSTPDALDSLIKGRPHFTIEQWRGLLLRSVGFEPTRLSQRQQDILLARMVPFVVPNYNAVELGPRGTGKSHLFQQISPYSYLVSGGKATVATMFVNNTTGRRGLVAQYDVVCFDEVAGVSFDSKDGVNILKGYMESGEFARGKESIRAEGGIVLVGNFEVDVWEQLRRGHLLAPLPKEMRDDTAFMDRIHAYLPGWDVPKLDPSYFTPHFGFVSDFLAECWSLLRRTSRMAVVQERLNWGPDMSGRDRKAAENTVNGLLKLLYPDPEMEAPEEELAWMADLALEMRRRVKEQQAHIGKDEFGKTDLSYAVGNGPQKIVYCEETVRFRQRSEPDDAELPEPDPSELATPGPAPTSYAVGNVIDDRFEVLAVLGEGGFSKVYRVHDCLEDEVRAFKIFSSADGYEAVRREIGALRRVRHPNVVEVYWAGKTAHGQWFLITEYVDGRPLSDFVYGPHDLSDAQCIEIATGILTALVAIHPNVERIREIEERQAQGSIGESEFAELQELKATGLVHRDVKPENVILTDRNVKLLDFNITSRVGDPVVTLAGTPLYAAPDPFQTEWDVSTDLFAVGVILYMLLCGGKHPYPNQSPNVGAAVIDPLTFRPDLSDEMAAFLQKACAPRREHRFQTAVGMLTGLGDAAGQT